MERLLGRQSWRQSNPDSDFNLRVKNINRILNFRKARLPDDCDCRMPISLNEAVEGIFCDWGGVCIKGEAVIDGLSKQSSYFFHLLIALGWDVNKKLFAYLSCCVILQSIEKNSKDSEAAGYNSGEALVGECHFSCFDL